MSDLISRQAAIDGKIPIQLSNGVEIYYDEAVVPVEYLKHLPSADVVERKKGEWIPVNNVGDCCYKCSICGYVYDAYSLRADNFCQSCGADMRKGEENERIN